MMALASISDPKAFPAASRLIVLGVIVLAMANSCAASEPIAVLCFAETQRLGEDLQLLAELSGSPELGDKVLAWLSRKSGIARLDGMDTARPSGAVIESDGLVVNPVAFFPVNDAQTLLASLSGVVGPTERRPDGLWKINHGNFSGFVREQNGWMFFAQDAAALANPPDPLEVMGNLPNQYDAALRMNLQQIPDVFRQFLIDLLRTILRADLEKRPDESQAVHHLRSSWLRFEFDMFERVISESEEVTFGYSVDAALRRAEFDLHFRPLPETSLSGMLQNLRQADTRFSALVDPEAAILARATVSMGEPEIERATSHLNDLRGPVEEVINSTQMIESDVDRELLGRLVGTLFDTADATINSGRLDMAVLARSESSPINVLAAGHVGNSENLQQLLERIAESSMAEDPWQLKMNVAEFAPDEDAAGNLQAIPVHALEFDTANAQVLERLFGTDARLYLAMGEDVVWMGIGPDALKGLEGVASNLNSEEFQADAATHTAATNAPIFIQLQLGDIAAVAAQASDNLLWRFWMGSIATGLQAADDTLTFKIHADERELHAQLAMEEGVLRAVATALSLRLANEETAEEQ